VTAMRRPSLSTLLVVVNAGLLLLAVAGVAYAAAALLQRFADEQALARVAQTSLTAQQEISRAGDDALISARLLSERPTLLRLLQAGDVASLNAFLSQFQRTSQLGGCAVLRDGHVIAGSGAALPWATIAGLPHDPNRFLYRPAPAQPLVLGARADIPGLVGA